MFTFLAHPLQITPTQLHTISQHLVSFKKEVKLLKSIVRHYEKTIMECNNLIKQQNQLLQKMMNTPSVIVCQGKKTCFVEDKIEKESQQQCIWSKDCDERLCMQP